MDLATLYHRTVERWADCVCAVRDDQWDAPTPCRDWDVRALVSHLAGEDLWTVPLMGGSTIEEVGDRFDGDVLGDDPTTTALEAAKAATTAVAGRLPRGGTVQLSFGETDVAEYVWQLAADHLVHSWDLSAALGTDRHLDPAVVAGVAGWFAGREALYRSSGAVGPRGPGRGGEQDDLLAAFGRDPQWGPNHACAARLSEAFGMADADAAAGQLTDDCVFEATGPAPDGVRHEGSEAIGAAWRQMFAETRQPQFTEEEAFVSGDRGVLRWTYSWVDDQGTPGHVRGIDLLRFRDGLVCEKLSYVKG